MAGVAALAGALLVGAPSANAATKVFGVTAEGQLATFKTSNLNRVRVTRITGLPDGVRLVGLDQRPSTGGLYGIGDDSTVYRVSKRGRAGAIDASLSGTGFGGFLGETALEGNSFGVDFNPVPDAIRIVSDAGQNLRVSPETGQLIAEDGDINGADAVIVDAAYTNSQLNGGTPPDETALFVLDAKNDRVYLQNPPNDGTLDSPVSLSLDVTKRSGFDLIGNGNRGLIVDGKGRNSSLTVIRRGSYSALDGGTRRLGKVRAGSKLIGIAVAQR